MTGDTNTFTPFSVETLTRQMKASLTQVHKEGDEKEFA